jgi:hypothetical protein
LIITWEDMDAAEKFKALVTYEYELDSSEEVVAGAEAGAGAGAEAGADFAQAVANAKRSWQEAEKNGISFNQYKLGMLGRVRRRLFVSTSAFDR